MSATVNDDIDFDISHKTKIIIYNIHAMQNTRRHRKDEMEKKKQNKNKIHLKCWLWKLHIEKLDHNREQRFFFLSLFYSSLSFELFHSSTWLNCRCIHF